MTQSIPTLFEQVQRQFAAFLRERGLRQTRERGVVLEGVYATEGHFDAETLYLRLREEGAGVSRATVYNTLDILTDCHLVERHQFGNKQAKYERAFHYRQHDHLICLDCNELFEFCDPRIQSIQEMVSEIFDFEITHHSLHMYGHCRKEPCPNRTPLSAGP